MLILRSLCESENQRRRAFRTSRRANEHYGQKQGQAKHLLLYNTLKIQRKIKTKFFLTVTYHSIDLSQAILSKRFTAKQTKKKKTKKNTQIRHSIYILYHAFSSILIIKKYAYSIEKNEIYPCLFQTNI